MSRARSFVIEKTTYDVTQASKFGEIVYVYSERERRSSIWSDDFVRDVLNRLSEADFDPSADYFVIAGSTVPVTKIVAALAATYGRFRALCFSATDHDYVFQEYGGELCTR